MSTQETMSKAKVLIVEDEIITAAALRNALQEMGFSICSLTTSGEKAIKAAEHELPDIILMDVNLGGGMNGFEAASEIHSRFSIPIVFMTGYEDDNTMELANAVEHSGYLIKPIEPEELKLAIDKALYKYKGI